MIRRPGLAGVTAGLQTMPPLATVDRFKRHAGYALEPHHTAVFVRPWFRELLQSRLADAALRVSARWLGPTEGLSRVKAVREATRVQMSDLAVATESRDTASGVVPGSG
jgi:hypothetical protein